MTHDEKSVPLELSVAGFRRHLGPHRRLLITVSILGVLSAIANGFVPYLTGLFFDSLIALSSNDVQYFYGLPLWLLLLLVWAVAQLVAGNADWIIDRMRRRIEIYAHVDVQVNGFLHLFRLPLNFHKNAHINESLEMISRAGWRTTAVARALIRIAPQLISILVGLILAALISPLLASILAAGVVLYSMLLLWLLRPVAAYDDQVHRSWNKAWNDVAEAVTQVESVKQAAAEEYETIQAKRRFYDGVAQTWEKLEKIWSNAGLFQRIIVFATQMTIFILSVSMITTGSLSVGELVALNGYALMFFGPIIEFGHSWEDVQNGITAVGQAERMFQTKTEIYHPQNMRSPDQYQGRVEFDHVTYGYEDDRRTILSDISFHVEPGQTIAFVGRSGVGKSTAISLISAYYFPSYGSVRVDGVDTRHLDLLDLRKHIAVVPQEVALFNNTIRANICYGSFDASDVEIEAAARSAMLHDFIESLPLGYDTLVGERGIKLSVGQKQRVAIARATLRNPAILILDEPTSALDAETEQAISESLERLMENRTTFIIAHRLSTVRRADRILVFKEGRIVEEGTHEELVQIDAGEYQRFYSLQSGVSNES